MDAIFFSSFIDEMQKIADIIKQVKPGVFKATMTPENAPPPTGLFGKLKAKLKTDPSFPQTPKQKFKSKMDALSREFMEKRTRPGGATGKSSTGR